MPINIWDAKFNLSTKLASTRKIQKYPKYIQYLESIYPGVKLNLQIYSFIHKISPYCKICKNPVKTLAKTTCSVECRSALEQKENKVKDRLDKAAITNLERYGVENPAQLSEIQDKRLNTMFETYGAFVSPIALAATTARAADMNAKGKITLKERYNVENPGQLPDHYDKCKETLMENYGVTHYFYSNEYKEISDERRLNTYIELSPITITILNISDDVEKKLIFDDPNKIIEFRCQCGFTDAIPSETYKWRIRETLTPCIKCSGLNKGSKKEKDIKEFIESLGYVIIENKKMLNGKEIDIFIPSLNIGIEFDGLFYHNDLRIDKNYHIDKTNIAQEKGIKLIHIFEDEWDYKKEIVKSRLLSILGKIEEKIYARKCIIKTISLDEAKNFIDENHIQGYANSSIKLGLFYKDVLVSVMTFCIPDKSKSQKKEEGFWELSRFCSKINTQVVGAASKLLCYFEKNYYPKKLLSFADKRWSAGEVYYNLGFTEMNDTVINYWYIKGDKRFHRFPLRKNKDDDQSLSEYENRIKQGFLRIWDCGSKKFIKEYR